jgi:hypothetical protein
VNGDGTIDVNWTAASSAAGMRSGRPRDSIRGRGRPAAYPLSCERHDQDHHDGAE